MPKRPVIRRSASASACFVSTTCSKSFTRPTTSPIPRMREARPSGRNSSSRSTLSPVPTNLMGTPVTAFTARAAPPRASPSSLVSTSPSSVSCSANAFATFTASRPISASHTSSRLLGHQLCVDGEAAGGVVDDGVEAFAPRALASARTQRGRRLAGLARVHGHVDRRAQRLQLLHRGRALHVGRDQQRAPALLLEMARELRRDGGLADALEAEQQHRDGSVSACERGVHRPHQAHELFLAARHEVLARAHAVHAARGVAHLRLDPRAERFLAQAREEILHHLVVDVGLEQRTAHVPERLVEVGVGQRLHAGKPLARALEAGR